MRQFGELEAVIMHRLWAWGRPALVRDAAGQVARLAEMHADDAATAGRDARPLATALVVLASAGTGPVPETPALAAAGTDAVHRIQRLLAPAEPMNQASATNRVSR